MNAKFKKPKSFNPPSKSTFLMATPETKNLVIQAYFKTGQTTYEGYLAYLLKCCQIAESKNIRTFEAIPFL